MITDITIQPVFFANPANTSPNWAVFELFLSLFVALIYFPIKYITTKQMIFNLNIQILYDKICLQSNLKFIFTVRLKTPPIFQQLF